MCGVGRSLYVDGLSPEDPAASLSLIDQTGNNTKLKYLKDNTMWPKIKYKTISGDQWRKIIQISQKSGDLFGT